MYSYLRNLITRVDNIVQECLVLETEGVQVITETRSK